MAQKASGIRRSTATKLLDGLAQRAQEVNDDPTLVYYVSRIAVFGSYVNSNRDKLGDLDTAVELVPRYKGDDFVRANNEAFRLRGPQFSSTVDQVLFGYYEIKRYLRNRSKCLSLHDFDELLALDTEYVMIYDWTTSVSDA